VEGTGAAGRTRHPGRHGRRGSRCGRQASQEDDVSPIRIRVPSSGRLRSLTAGLLVTAGAVGVAVLSACDSSSGGGSGATTSPPGSGVSASFTGSVPSALSSLASAGRSAASAGVSSASAAASSFEASVKAQVEGDTAAANAALAKASGKGNAFADVHLTGLPAAKAGGLHAVVVTVTNTTGDTASFAVKVEFADSGGHVADTEVVNAKDVKAGKHATPIAFTTKETDRTLFPRVARAQRY
jgi:hypothetical protein